MSKSYCTIKFYSNFPINEYSNQVYYSNSNTRDNVFDGYCSNREGVDLYKNIASPNKTSMSFRLETNYKNAMNYNYGVVIEDNKRYYFFINNVEWSSNLITATFNCEVDWWQTYCYNVSFKKSYVEREHVIDDTFGKHIIDEGLPISEYKVIDTKTKFIDFKVGISIADTSDFGEYLGELGGPDFDKPIPSIIEINKVEKSCAIIVTTTEFSQYIINGLVALQKMDSINGLYMIPSECERYLKDCALNTNNTIEIDGEPIGYIITSCVKHNPKADIISENIEINRPNNINGYVPNNNKCFCYPYNFVNITNSIGNTTQGKFEYSNDVNKIISEVLIPITEGSSMSCYLKNYDGVLKNLDCSVTTSQYPELPYVTNTYSAYISANQNSIANQRSEIERNEAFAQKRNIISGFTSIGENALSDNIFGTINAMSNTILNSKQTELNATNQRNRIDASLKDIESKGNISHGAFNPNKIMMTNQFGFKFQTMNVTRECIEMIDNYFDMFGYKVNTIKVPQFNSRPSWNYIKTSGVNIVGNVPQVALNVIKKMFDNGTTIWHNINTMYDYSKNNK